MKLFRDQAGGAVEALRSLTTDSSDIKRDGTGKEWSDEVTRNLVLLRLATSGISVLFDSSYIPESRSPTDSDISDRCNGDSADEDEDLGESGEEEARCTRRYPAGYPFSSLDDPLYVEVHELRDDIGRTLHQVHQFLSSKQEDDVACFNALYTVRL